MPSPSTPETPAESRRSGPTGPTGPTGATDPGSYGPPYGPPPPHAPWHAHYPPPSNDRTLANVALILIGVLVALALVLVGHLMAGQTRQQVAPCWNCASPAPSPTWPQPSNGRPMGHVSKGGTPEAGRTVELRGLSAPVQATTDANGDYVFSDQLTQGGRYTTEVLSPSGAPSSGYSNPHTWYYQPLTGSPIDFAFD